jgi:hypothetical protein
MSNDYIKAFLFGMWERAVSSKQTYYVYETTQGVVYAMENDKYGSPVIKISGTGSVRVYDKSYKSYLKSK